MTTDSNSQSAIPKITRDDEEAGSGDLARENVERLKALFPQIVADGKVDFDVLRQLLGDEVEEGEERYGLNWKGKRRARAFAMTPSLGTLLPAREDSVDWDTTRNIMIEGDNLEVLKLLRRSYAGKVKLIYLDPPYNTGKDFVYPDDYKQSLENYMRATGQVDETQRSLSSNKEGSGRFHTDWLNMLYPRLLIAKELLAKNGAIFVSCDNSEVEHLITMMNEIFGQERQAAILTWLTKQAARGVPPVNMLITNHEYLVGYDNSEREFSFLGEPRDLDDFEDDGDVRGPWRSESMRATGQQDNYFDIVNPETGDRFHGNWAFSEETVGKMVEEEKIIWPRSPSGTPRQKKFYDSYINDRKAIVSHWGWHSTERSTARLIEMFDGEKVFDFPKPLSLMRKLVEQSTSGDDIVLDFFAGSGTTGHAIYDQNIADQNSRRFILVQLPEMLDATASEQRAAANLCRSLGKPSNIAELTKERLRRAGKLVREENTDIDIDTGFRVYKLSTSNLKPWQPDASDLEASILDAVENVLPDRTEEDLLVELLLKTGIDLTMPEEERDIAGQTVHALGGGALMVCLGNIADEQAEELGQGMADWVDELDPAQTTVYFKDSGIGSDGNRAATKANLAAILRQRLGDRIAKIASI